MKTNKLFTLLLCGALCAGFCACDPTNEPDNNQQEDSNKPNNTIKELLLDSTISYSYLHGELLKYTYTYDETGTLSEYYACVYEGNQLRGASKSIYRDWKKDEFTISMYADTYELNLSNNEYEFAAIQYYFEKTDSKGNLIEYEQNQYTTTQECTSKYHDWYTYNSYGDIISTKNISYSYGVSDDASEINTTYSYEYENNLPVVMLKTVDNGGPFVPNYKYIYSYDANGRKIMEERYEGGGDYWAPLYKNEYSYENNSSTLTLYYDWNESLQEWELRRKAVESENIDGNNMIKTTDNYSYNNEAQNWDLLGSYCEYYSEKVVKSASHKRMMYKEQNHYNPHNIPVGHQPFDVEHKK